MTNLTRQLVVIQMAMTDVLPLLQKISTSLWFPSWPTIDTRSGVFHPMLRVTDGRLFNHVGQDACIASARSRQKRQSLVASLDRRRESSGSDRAVDHWGSFLLPGALAFLSSCLEYACPRGSRLLHVEQREAGLAMNPSLNMRAEMDGRRLEIMGEPGCAAKLEAGRLSHKASKNI